jgi:starch synthase
LKKNKIAPDILHCHDWHTGLIPYLLYTNPDPFFSKVRTLLTIHNIAFQGKFPATFLDIPETWQLFDSIDKSRRTISFMRLGVSSADYISTVSENHAKEIKSGIADFGLQKLINLKADRFSGILNGIDYSVWNPQRDKYIQHQYSRSDVAGVKVKNKLALQRSLGLKVDSHIPLFGFIARLSTQKGVDLILRLLKNVSDLIIQVVILGKGDRKIESQLQMFAASEYKSWIHIRLGFDEALAHQIYAGSDFLLIPSEYEPCGLTQMIAMRYGTIPIASSVGGLKDTITDGENGLLFESKDKASFLAQIDRSLKLWQNPKLLIQIQQTAMKTNFSWTRSALKYRELYSKMLS